MHTFRASTAKVALLDIIAEKSLEAPCILRSQDHLVPTIVFRHPFAEPLLGLAILIVDCCVDKVPCGRCQHLTYGVLLIFALNIAAPTSLFVEVVEHFERCLFTTFAKEGRPCIPKVHRTET